MFTNQENTPFFSDVFSRFIRIIKKKKTLRNCQPFKTSISQSQYLDVSFGVTVVSYTVFFSYTYIQTNHVN